MAFEVPDRRYAGPLPDGYGYACQGQGILLPLHTAIEYMEKGDESRYVADLYYRGLWPREYVEQGLLCEGYFIRLRMHYQFELQVDG